jgi:hypothetical protein
LFHKQRTNHLIRRQYEFIEAGHRGIFRNLLAGISRMRKRCAGGGISQLGIGFAGVALAFGLTPWRLPSDTFLALSQLWLFWLAPIVGRALAGGFYNAVFRE